MFNVSAPYSTQYSHTPRDVSNQSINHSDLYTYIYLALATKSNQ